MALHAFTSVYRFGMMEASCENDERGGENERMNNITSADKAHSENCESPKDYITPVIFVGIAEFVKNITTAHV
jgi:hypothetical protein